MAENFITKTTLPKVALTAVDEAAVLQSDSDLKEVIAASSVPDLSAFFATPVLGPEDAAGNVSVSWYSSVAGRPKVLDLLDGLAREDVAERLNLRLQQIQTLKAERPELASKLDAATSVLTREDILAITGQPVLINWGTLPENSEPAAHFRSTFGQVLSENASRQVVDGAVPQVPAQTVPVAGAAAVPSAGGSSLPPGGAPRPVDAAYGQLHPQGVPPPNHPWWAIVPLAILTVFLLAVLIWLALPGARLFPPEPPALVGKIDDGAASALEGHNADLERRLAELQDALRLGHCTPDGSFVLPTGNTPEGVLPPPHDPDIREPNQDPQLDEGSRNPLLPPNPDRVEVPGPPTDGTGTAAPTTNIVDLIERNSVLIVTQSGIGTGFFIAPNIVFTNHHVIEEAIGIGRVLVINEALGQLTQAQILSYDGPFEQTGGDFALLRTDITVNSFFSLLDGVVDVKGQGVIAAGYPGDIVTNDVRFTSLIDGTGSEIPDMVVTNGIVNSAQQIAADISMLIHSASISQGNSGGPLVDLCGRVVGMNTFVSQQAFRNLNMSQTGAAMEAFLSANTHSEARIENTDCTPKVAPVTPTPAPEAVPQELSDQ